MVLFPSISKLDKFLLSNTARVRKHGQAVLQAQPAQAQHIWLSYG